MRAGRSSQRLRSHGWLAGSEGSFRRSADGAMARRSEEMVMQAVLPDQRGGADGDTASKIKAGLCAASHRRRLLLNCCCPER